MIVATLDDGPVTKSEIKFTINGYDCRMTKVFTPTSLSLSVKGGAGESIITDPGVPDKCGGNYQFEVRMSTGDPLNSFIQFNGQKIIATPTLDSHISIYAVQYVIWNTVYDAINTLFTLTIQVTKCEIKEYTATTYDIRMDYVMGFAKQIRTLPNIT